MKKYKLLVVVFLLTGCPGPGDRMISQEPTTAIIKDGQVCVVSPLTPQEQITAIQINSAKSDTLHKIFDDNPVYVAKGECLPLFGFTFIPRERYSIAYDVKSERLDFHLVTVEFSTALDNARAIKIF